MEWMTFSPGAPTLPPGLYGENIPEGGADGGQHTKNIPNKEVLRTHHCAACTAYTQCRTVLPYLCTAVLCTAETP